MPYLKPNMYALPEYRSTKSGINMDAVRIMGGVIKKTAELTKDRQRIGAAKLVVFAMLLKIILYGGGLHDQENRLCYQCRGID